MSENETFYLKVRKKVDDWLQTEPGKSHKWSDMILLAPDMFYMLWKLSLDKEVPAKSKAKLAGVIMYFILPFDLLPEAILGPAGYMDDIALSAYILNLIVNETHPQIVRKYWPGENDILYVLKTILVNADKALGKGLWQRVKKKITI